MLTREERHALAARIRLGERSRKPVFDNKWQSKSGPVEDSGFIWGWHENGTWVMYALDTLIVTCSGAVSAVPVWEDGTEWKENPLRYLPYPKLAMAYLEKD